MTNDSIEKQLVKNVERSMLLMEHSLDAVYPGFLERFPADSAGDQTGSRARFAAIRRAYEEALLAQIRWSIWIDQ